MITQGQIIQFLEKAFGNVRLTNNGLNACVSCPICAEKKDIGSKKKLVIRTDTWLSHCWVCGFKARNIYWIIKKYKQEYLSEYEFLSGYKPLTFTFTAEPLNASAVHLKLPDGFTLLAPWFKALKDAPWHVREGINYLLSRKVTERDLWYWKFGTTEEEPEYKNRVIIPSFDAEGNLNYFTARSFKKNLKPPYFNPKFERENIIFNELNISWEEELTLVEGPFDAIKCNDNVSCLLGSELSEKYKLFQQILKHQTPILLALDPDAIKKTLAYIKLFISYGIQVRLLELPKNKKDVGELTKEEFKILFKDAKILNEQDYVRLKLVMMV